MGHSQGFGKLDFEVRGLRAVRLVSSQWQLDPAVVKLELEGVCAQYGSIDVYVAPYVEGPRESKVRNALKVPQQGFNPSTVTVTRIFPR